MKNITHGHCKIKSAKNMNKIFVTLLLSFIASARLQAQEAQPENKESGKEQDAEEQDPEEEFKWFFDVPKGKKSKEKTGDEIENAKRQAPPAQNGYVKYQSGSEYRNKTVKVFKGEIVPCLRRGNKIDVVIGNDTIKDLPFPSKDYKIVQPVANYQSQKETLAQLTEGGIVLVKATAIPNSDTVTLIAESGQALVQLATKREAKAELSRCGNTFRLIFTDAPSIFYNSNKLILFVEPPVEAPIAEEGYEEEGFEKASEADWPWTYYALIFLAAGGIGFCVRLFLHIRKNNSDDYVCYNGDSLSRFAAKYGGLDFLHAINPKLMPTRKEWDKIRNTIDGEAMIQKLKGKKIRIRQTARHTLKSGNANKNYKAAERTNAHIQSADSGNYNELAERLEKTEGFIHEIQKLNNNQGEVKRLQDEKKELEAKLKRIENEKSTLESALQKANAGKNTAQNEIEEL